MTRFARMQKRKHLEASPWEELAGACTGKERANEDNERTLDQVHANKGKKMKGSKERKTLKRKESDDDCVAHKTPKISDTRSVETGHVISHNHSKVELTKPKGNTEKCEEENSQGRKRLKHKSSEMGREREKAGLSRISSSSPALQKSFSQTRDQRNHEKLEKRREARRKRREKKKVCLHCRQPGHKVSECPQSEVDQSGVGTCYKCGSLDHMTKNCRETIGGDNPFPFAKCFVCGEKGHLARECPENPRGLYPRGGGCKMCGSVEHLKRDCPEKLQNKMKGIKDNQNYASSSLGQRGHTSADAELGQDTAKSEITTTKKKGAKVVQF